MKLKKKEIYILIGIILILTIGVAWAIDETVTVSTTPKGLTSANYLTFTHGICKVEDQSVYFTQDGITTPTSAGVGIKVDIGQTINFTLQDQIKNFSAVRSGTPDAHLKCAYW